ncbi:hypothetical protein MJT46_018664 [Ovis ammon polii x Ovis aries]|nr:hypothetical protein MJT46_018664 [Ovis ammon polii x Ovis aries]
MADLSKETLESLTDEVKSSGSFSSSGGLQPWSSASGSKSESGSQPSRSEYGDHQSELSDFKANVKKLSRKWIHNLKGKETKSEQYRADTKYQTEITQASLEELNALQSFCTVKNVYLFIRLHQVLVAARGVIIVSCGIFPCVAQTSSCCAWAQYLQYVGSLAQGLGSAVLRVCGILVL